MIWEPEMILGLDSSGNYSEKVFGCGRKAHHSVGLKLAEIYDRVTFVEPSGIFKGLGDHRLGEIGRFLTEISV